jgi:hypothetical protein
MSTPEQGSILQQFEASRTEGNLFQSAIDFALQGRIVEEQVERLGAAVHLFVTSTQREPQGPLQSSGVDTLYGDILDPEFFSNPEEKDQRKFNLRCIVEHKPPRQMLKRYGIDEERDVIFHFPFTKLKALGLVTETRFRGVDIGDLVFWDGTWYLVLNSHREAFFGQTVSSYFTTAACKRYRHNSVPTNDVADHEREELA